MREIKFRYIWRGIEDGHMATEIVPLECLEGRGDRPRFGFDNTSWELVARDQYTGLKDCDGTEIYEGDVVRVRTPYRTYQDHYGENIPGPSGHYREPLEPAIQSVHHTVLFKEGMFIAYDEAPLAWERVQWDAYGMRAAFEMGAPDETEEDLGYLLELHELASEGALIDYLGLRVIGNIHEHPELVSRNT
jgi:hypothetical protein